MWALPLNCVFMKCFAWNCSGAENPTFVRTLSHYTTTYRPSCIAIFETKCDVSRAKNVFERLGFDNFITQEGVGRGGGIWFAWKSNIITVHSHMLHQNFIHLQGNVITRSGGVLLCMLILIEKSKIAFGMISYWHYACHSLVVGPHW